MAQRLILASAALRSFAIGLVAVMLGLHLAALGFQPKGIGLVVGLGLAGNALSTALLAGAGERVGRKRTLLTLSALSTAGLATLALTSTTGVIVVAAFLGMVNGMGRDRGAAQAVDQAILAERVQDRDRTPLFVRYTLAQDIAAAFGSLALGVPAWLQRASGLDAGASYRWMFAAAAVTSLAQLLLYARLRLPAAHERAADWESHPRVSGAAKRRVAGLSGLFAMDSLGGGFLAGTILSYWFFRRHGLPPDAIGAIFFGARLLNALSYLAAGALARRVGLVRTMVFTHLPANLLLLVLPFVDVVWLAVALFLLRESLVQMDVPTRQSYVAAIVLPHERTFALGATNVVRHMGWTAGPPLAGFAMATAGLAAPLVTGASLKIVYDLSLYAGFRRVRPPEEAGSAS